MIGDITLLGDGSLRCYFNFQRTVFTQAATWIIIKSLDSYQDSMHKFHSST